MAAKVANSSHEVFDVVRGRFAMARARGETPKMYDPGNTGTIPLLYTALSENAEVLTEGLDVKVYQTLALDPKEGWRNATKHGVIPITSFIGPGMRDLIHEGVGRILRTHLSRLHMVWEWLRPDVAFAHVSLPDTEGRVTLGLNAGLDISAVKNAKFKIAVINSNMPRWHIGTYFDPLSRRTFESGCAMHLDDFDLIFKSDTPLLEHIMEPKELNIGPSEIIAKTIIEHLSHGIEKSNVLPYTLQLGIGAVPNAIARALAERGISIERVWSELISGGVDGLHQKGLIRRTEGPHLRDHIVTGFVLGSREQYMAMHEDPTFLVLPQEDVNDPGLIRLNRQMVSVNAALAVSLLGEVVASSLGNRWISGVGGQDDFADGAIRSEGGRAYIALPSTATPRGKSRESRIVAIHDEGAHHTLSADSELIFVTEWGLADTRGRDDTERGEKMILLAHPDDRVELGKAIRRRAAMQGVGVISPRIVTLKKSRQQVTVRPATRNDIPAIITYLTQQSREDLRTRYMHEINLLHYSRDQNMIKSYDHSLDFEGHAAFVVELHGAIVGVTHAVKTDEGSFEVSFSRLSSRWGEGIGKHLMCILIDWAELAQVERLHAVTYRFENPRMRKLFDKFHFVPLNDPGEPRNILYSGDVKNLVYTRRHLKGM